VQLLVPLLHPRAVLLLDVVPVHDVQNVVADCLPVAAAPRAPIGVADLGSEGAISCTEGVVSCTEGVDSRTEG
jgi:hypothetical protein